MMNDPFDKLLSTTSQHNLDFPLITPLHLFHTFNTSDEPISEVFKVVTEVPHADIHPESTILLILRIENHSHVVNVSSLEEFKASVPDLSYVSEAEMYLLYCYFYGASVCGSKGKSGNTVTLVRRTKYSNTSSIVASVASSEHLVFAPSTHATLDRQVSFTGKI